MQLDPNEQRSGMRWLIGAGLAAVLLSISLALIDFSLSSSKYEQELSSTLRELRKAQFGVPAGEVDPRMHAPPVDRGAIETIPNEH